jgi:hypothetical protein
MPNHLDPQPIGAWAEAIRHLRAAHELMAEMNIGVPREDSSLGEIYERQMMVMISSVDQHYRRLYMEIATRPSRMIIHEDGTVESLS